MIIIILQHRNHWPSEPKFKVIGYIITLPNFQPQFHELNSSFIILANIQESIIQIGLAGWLVLLELLVE